MDSVRYNPENIQKKKGQPIEKLNLLQVSPLIMSFILVCDPEHLREES